MVGQCFSYEMSCSVLASHLEGIFPVWLMSSFPFNMFKNKVYWAGELYDTFVRHFLVLSHNFVFLIPLIVKFHHRYIPNEYMSTKQLQKNPKTNSLRKLLAPGVSAPIPLSAQLSAPGCSAPALRWSVSRGSRRWPRAARRSHSARSASSETLCMRCTWPNAQTQENKHYTKYCAKSTLLLGFLTHLRAHLCTVYLTSNNITQITFLLQTMDLTDEQRWCRYYRMWVKKMYTKIRTCTRPLLWSSSWADIS